MDTEALHDLTAAYALDALDEHDVRAYEEHLAHCERCRAELASLTGAATSLAYGVDAPPPPPELRDRILETARADRENVTPMRPRWTLPAALAAATLATAAAVVLGLWASSLHGKLDRERAATSLTLNAAQVVAEHDARRIPLRDNFGTLFVSTAGEGALVLNGLPLAPPGKTYEAWVIAAGNPSPAALFPGGDAVSIIALTPTVPNGAVVAITLEPAGGNGKPTRPILTSARSA